MKSTTTFLEQIQFQFDHIAFIPLLHNIVNHGFSWGKGAGNMSHIHGNTFEVDKRIGDYLKKIGMNSISNSIFMEPEHSDRIVDINVDVLSNTNPLGELGRFVKCDAFFTELHKTPLIVTPADCTVSVICGLTTSGKQIIGMVHAGRKGLDLFLPQKAIHHLLTYYKCKPDTILIGVPPSLTAKHNSIRSLSDLMHPSHWQHYSSQMNEYYYLDNLSNLLDQYRDCGIRADHVQIYKVDTFEAALEGESYSHRCSQMNEWVGAGRFIVSAQL